MDFPTDKQQISADAEAVGARIEMGVQQGLQMLVPLLASAIMAFFAFLSEQFGKVGPVIYGCLLGSISLPIFFARSELMIHHPVTFLRKCYKSLWIAWRRANSKTGWLATFDVLAAGPIVLWAYIYDLVVAHRLGVNAVWITVLVFLFLGCLFLAFIAQGIAKNSKNPPSRIEG